MPQLDIPLNSNVVKNVDGSELIDESANLIDGYRDALGANISRPGLDQIADIGLSLGRSCQGHYWWDQKQCAICVYDDRIYKVTKSGTAYTVTDLTGEALQSQSRCTFTQDGTYCFIANGGKPVYTDGTALTAFLADADAPTAVTHVAYLDGYIIANQPGISPQAWTYSQNEASLSWDPGDYFSAVSDADALSAIHVFQRELYFFGPKSTEIWENDGTTPFAPVPGGILQVGCQAPYSIVNNEDGVYWFDEERRLVHFGGRSVEALSTDFDGAIEQFTSIEDCHAMRIKIAGVSFLVFQFPTANKTLVYNYKDKSWSEWGRWLSQVGQYERWLIDGYCYSPKWNVHLAGSRLGSKIYAMSKDYIDDDGDPIRFLRETGHINRGTHTRKRSTEITLMLKRGDTTPVVSGRDRTITLEMLDDNKLTRTREIDLGDAGDNDLIRRLGPTGIYVTRKYSLTSTAPVHIVIREAKEDFDILR